MDQLFEDDDREYATLMQKISTSLHEQKKIRFSQILFHEKFKANSFCVGGRHYSGTVNIEPYITKTGQKLSVGECIKCNRFETMAVKDDTIKTEGLRHLFKNIGKASVEAGKKLASMVMNKP